MRENSQEKCFLEALPSDIGTAGCPAVGIMGADHGLQRISSCKCVATPTSDKPCNSDSEDNNTTHDWCLT